MLILYREELKALMRGRYAWLGAGVVMLGLGGLAAASTQDTWLDSYGIVAYFLAPLMFIPLAAGVIAAPRANRFVECVFTAPVDRRAWLAAKILVLITLAGSYYLALLPMMLVYVAHIGMPFLLTKLLLWTPGILIASIAIGTLIGVLFIGRSVAPPIATGVGVLLLLAVCVPLQELMVARGFGAAATSHLTLVSPAVLLKNGLGFALVASTVPASTLLTWCCFTFDVLGALALAAWIFLRTQGVESWEATRSQRRMITVAFAALVLLPVIFADTDYDRPAPATNAAPGIRGLFLRGGGLLALTTPGGILPPLCCSTLLNRGQWPSLPVGEATQRDLFLLLPVESSQSIQDLRIQIVGQNGLQVQADPAALGAIGEHLEKHSYPNDSGPVVAEVRHIPSGWVARLPVAITPTAPWDIGGVRYPLEVTASYHLVGDPSEHNLRERAAVEAQVPNALIEMGSAAAVLPLLCFAVALARRRRTR